MSNTDYYKKNEDVIKHRNRMNAKKLEEKRKQKGMRFQVKELVNDRRTD